MNTEDIRKAAAAKDYNDRADGMDWEPMKIDPATVLELIRLAEIDVDRLLQHIRAQDEKLGRVTETMEAHKQCRQQCNCLELLDAILNGSKGSKP